MSRYHPWVAGLLTDNAQFSGTCHKRKVYFPGTYRWKSSLFLREYCTLETKLTWEISVAVSLVTFKGNASSMESVNFSFFYCWHSELGRNNAVPYTSYNNNRCEVKLWRELEERKLLRNFSSRLQTVEYKIYVLLIVHSNIMMVFLNQLDRKIFILIHLLYSSTCFQHYCAHLQVNNCISTAPGFVTLFGWQFSTQFTIGPS